MLSVDMFVSTSSRMLPLTLVGWSINWTTELSKTKLQKALDGVEVEESVYQCISGRLKSPKIIMSVDGLD